MEKLVIAFLGLLIVLFIGNVVYTEAFADCASPGAMTWTITLDPGKCGTITPGSAPATQDSQSDAEDVLPEPGASPTIRDNVPRDASGNPATGVKRDASGNSLLGGNWLNLSLSDIASLVSSNKPNVVVAPPMQPMQLIPRVIPLPPPPPSAVVMMTNTAGVAMAGSGTMNGLRNQFEDPLTRGINSAAWPSRGAQNDPNTYMYTPMTNQGQQYLSGTPMNNPADLSMNPDYIRKDSIPCWACNP